MENSINDRLKTDFLILNNLSDTDSTLLQTFGKFEKCNECNKEVKIFDEIEKVCYQCYKIGRLFVSCGNKVIDDFIKHTLASYDKIIGKMEFIPYYIFKDVEFIAEGGFSKVYKATWIDGPIINWREDRLEYDRNGEMKVALKKLNNSKNISSKELNELKIFSDFKSRSDGTFQDHILYGHFNYINIYYGITQDPVTEDYMIIMKYYELGDLTNYITEDFFNISCYDKLCRLYEIIKGLRKLHDADIIHKDYHSGNIFVTKNIYIVNIAITGDLGINKSAIELNDEIYGIIPYVAPEIFQGQKYTKASDIYSFGMIMWELMTGRKPFWDRNHDIDLIVEICDGLRPPAIRDIYKGYMNLIQQCWHPDPNKRPTASELDKKIYKIKCNEFKNCLNQNPTKIIKSLDIGPIKNNSGAIYKSRPLGEMIKSAISIRSLKSSNDFPDKRELEDSPSEEDNDKTIKKIKLDNDNSDDLAKGLELDSRDDTDYISEELNLDIE